MATSAEVTEQHRQAQLAVRAAFLQEFLPTWQLLDWTRIDATAPAWVRVVMALVQVFRQRSAATAEQYYDAIRLLDAPDPLTPPPALTYLHAVPDLGGPVRLPDGRNERVGGVVADRVASSDSRRLIDPSSSDTPRRNRVTFEPNQREGRARVTYEPNKRARIDWSEWDKAAQHSLIVTGPIELKKQASRGVQEQQAKDRAIVASAGAASRHVLNGGREATLTLVKADSQAIGWARVTDGDPCGFCALLASRGPAYKTEASAAFKPHDHCACLPKAVYSRTAGWPGDAREYQRFYYQVTKGYSGKEAVKAFNRAWYQRQQERKRQAGSPPIIAARTA